MLFRSEGSYNREAYARQIASMNQGKSILSYLLFKDIDPRNKSNYPISPDVPVVVRSPVVRNVNKVESHIPENLVLKYNENSDPDPSVIARTLLGSNLDNYDEPETDKNGTVTMKNSNNTYRMHTNGLMEYSYWSQAPASDRGDIREAFARAMEFISVFRRHTGKVPGYTLMLSQIRISEEGRYYEFVFDYMVSGRPVIYEGITGSDGSRSLNNALIIRTNAARVLNCWWIVRNFRDLDSGKNGSLLYDARFERFMDKYDSTYGDIRVNSSIYIKDISIAYRGEGFSDNSHLTPVWRVKVKSGSNNLSYKTIELQ